MRTLPRRMSEVLGGLSPRVALALAAVLIPMLGLVDFVTGYELSFSLFYLVPVALAAWFASRMWGQVIAVIAATSWLTADMAAGHVYSATWTPYWNAAIRLGLFLVVARSLSGLRAALRREAESARTDYMTGVANKRAFTEVAGVEIERSRRYAHSFSIAYLDVDHFKRVNDTMGHDGGDKLLRDIGRCLTATVRAPDVVGRLGGDEFALLLVETAFSEAEATISRVQRALAAMTRAEGWDVTFSVGVTTFVDAPATVESALQHADRLMYAVKETGRDNVRHAVWQN